MLILALDTTAKTASAALMRDDEIIAEYSVNIGLQHSKTIMPMVKSLLESCEVKPNEIDLYAVAAGPGSFTGVRIGVAAIKGMAFVNDTPCVAVSSLYALALIFPLQNGIICPVMDARCNQVYNAVFDVTNGVITRICDDRAIKIDELIAENEQRNKSIYWLGDGAQMCYNRLVDKENQYLVPSALRLAHASGTAKAALENYRTGKAVSPNELLPFYLRAPQAVQRNQANQANQNSERK